MRIKKAIAVLLCVAMVLSLISVEAFAATGTATVSVETTATNVQAGDTVNYTVYLGDCAGLSDEGGLYNLDFNISVPDGLTFVAKSGVVDSNFSTATGFGMPAFNEAKMKFSSMGALASGYVGGKIPVMTFSCTVNAGAAGAKEVTLENVVFAASSGTFTASVKSATVKVPVPVTGVTLDKSALSLDLKNNKTATLTATVAPDNATDKTVTWSSSAPAVATVENGVVTAVSEGKATITATAGDKSASCEVTVVNCNHSYTKMDTTKDGACKTPGTCMTEAVYYYSCEHCGMVEKNDSHTFKGEKDLNNHSYTVQDTANSEALMTPGNCMTEAVYYCSCACGAVEKNADHTFTGAKDLNNHSYTAQPQKTEAVMTPGNCTTKTVYYYSCARCGKVEKDAAHTFEGAVDSTVHDYTAQVKKDETCYKLGTCTAEAEYYYSCSRCDAVEADVNHTFKGDKNPNTHADSQTPQHNDTQHWYHCAGCDTNYDYANHSGGTATCTAQAKCTVCQAAYGDFAAHVARDTYAHDDSDHWQVCKDCGVMMGDKAAHNATGNNVATCTAAAVCDTCGTSFGAALGHEMTKTDAKAATCTENGNNEYYTCSRCKKVFKDKDGKTETTVAAETIAALGHKMTKTEAKAATCTEDGYVAYWTCSVCNKMFSDAKGENEIAASTVVNKLGHEMTHHEPVEATCQKTGMSEYYECSRCKGLFRDSMGNDSVAAAESLVTPKAPHTSSDSYAYTTTEHWKFCTVCGEKLDKAAHVFNEDATAGTKTCQTCGYVVHTADAGDEHVCMPVDYWSFDDNSHWHVCEGCNEKCNEAAHDIDWVIDVEATTTSDGLRHGKCKVCDYVKQEVIVKITTTPTTPSHRPGSSTGSATSSDKVQSSKTFDAGIATYVGLSILSLTGSALVIGKKKEF